MSASPAPKPLDPATWDGDPELLVGHEESLTYDGELCDSLFATKQEALTAGMFLASRETAESYPDTSDTQIDRQASIDALKFIENIPWGDMSGYLKSIDESLRRAMEATRADFLRWEDDDAGERRFGDEYSLASSQVDALTPEWRLAYVARLLRSLAMSWGVGTDYAGRPIDITTRDAGTPASLLHQLDATIRRR